MKTALVTGNRGFVARHMIPFLREAGYVVSGFDINAARPVDARNYFRESSQRYDLVIHLAAVVGGRAKIEGAPMDLAVDLAIDAEMFQWALRTRPGKVVYFSSSAAYPTWMQERGSSLSLKEDYIKLEDVSSPDALYGWAKLTGEMLARDARAQGLDVLVVRPFSGYGADQALDYPFPSFAERATNRSDPFPIWGDGTQIRDWIHIDDVCQATLRAVELDVEGPINLGTGRGTSFNTLAYMFATATGYHPTLSHRLDAPTGVHTRVADPRLMHTFYEPQISLEDGIDEALDLWEAAA